MNYPTQVNYPTQAVLIRLAIFFAVLLIVGGSFLYRAVTEEVNAKVGELQAQKTESLVLSR